MIVGFPGESSADADETISFLSKSPLTYLHVFPCSDRPGTDATHLPAKVSGSEIRRRGKAVRDIGITLAVTDNSLKVRLTSVRPDNERVRVRITMASERLSGEVVGADM